MMEKEKIHHRAKDRLRCFEQDTNEMIQKYFGEKPSISKNPLKILGKESFTQKFHPRKFHMNQLGIRGKVALSILTGISTLGSKDLSSLESKAFNKIPEITDVQKFKALLNRSLKKAPKNTEKKKDLELCNS